VLAFSAGGDGGRRLPEFQTALEHFVCASQGLLRRILINAQIAARRSQRRPLTMFIKDR